MRDGTPAAASEAADAADSFQYLAFDQSSGALLAHGARAVYALARADLRAPDKSIEILRAGVAGKNLWQNQTPLSLARMVVDMLDDHWRGDPPYNTMLPI